MNSTIHLDRPEPGAALDHICMQSPDPGRLAAFFASRYGMQATGQEAGAPLLCSAPGRTVLIAPGVANAVDYFSFAFPSGDALHAYRAALAQRGAALADNPSPLFDAGAFSLHDPDGNVVAFGSRPAGAAGQAPTVLQHIAFRTTRMDAMLDFYTGVAGFAVSDLVKDDAGAVRACFLRSNAEHHALALFAAPVCRLDHHSYETSDIGALAGWADRVSRAGTSIHWGVGRHGPGNDVFFMVKDPDDNLVEISAELEQCDAARPAGCWKHEPQTLNLWGAAIMRS